MQTEFDHDFLAPWRFDSRLGAFGLALASAVGCTNDYGRFVVGEGGGLPGATGGDTSSGAGAATQGGTTSQASSGQGGLTGAGGSGVGGSGVGGSGVGGSGVGGSGVGGSGVGGSGVGGGTVSCASQYGLASGYQACPGLDCTFIAFTGAQNSCDDVCESFGGECLAMFDNGVGCAIDGPVACDDSTWNDAMCQCSIGCGGGPPCVALTCQGGVCQ